jgi:hypothetical protein
MGAEQEKERPFHLGAHLCGRAEQNVKLQGACSSPRVSAVIVHLQQLANGDNTRKKKQLAECTVGVNAPTRR